MKISKINKGFRKLAVSLIKFRWLIILLFVILISISFFGLRKIIVEYSNDSMFLPNDPLIVMTDEFKEIFGNDQYIGVLIESDSLFTYKNLTSVAALSEHLLDSVPFAEKVNSLTDIEYTVGNEFGMEIIKVVPDEIPNTKEGLAQIRERAYSKQSFSERLLSKDGRYSWIMLKLSPFPKDWQKYDKLMPEIAVGRAVEEIVTDIKYESLNPKATGIPYFNYKEKDFFDRESGRVVGIALLIAIFFLGFATKSVRGMIIPLIATVGTVIIIFGMAGFLQIRIAGLVLTVPILLTLAISIGYSIHVFTFFLKEIRRSGKRREAVLFAVEETGWPLLFTALTTFSALMSFLIIPVPAIRYVGVITAYSALMIFVFILFLMPVLLSFGKDRKPRTTSRGSSDSWLSLQMEKYSVRVLDFPKTILISAALIIGVLIYGMTKVEASFDLEKSMGEKVPYINDLLNVAKTELGSLYSYDIMLEFPNEGDAKKVENLVKLNTLSEFIASFNLIKRTSSILDVVKDMNQVLHEDNSDFYKIPDRDDELTQMLFLYENAGGTESEYWMDYEYRRLRIMIELEVYNSSELREQRVLLHDKAKELFPRAELSIVGTIPKFAKVNEYVVKGQVNSLLIAIGIISLLLMIVFASVKIGLIGLIPNVVPAVTVGGLMGLFGVPLDMMTVTIIPMILGLAVDDTIHFFNHGRLEFERTGNYRKALSRTFGSVGVALVLTTIILSANFLTYTTSVANIYFHSGLLATAGLVAALLADLLITPVLFKYFEIFGKERGGDGETE